MKPRFERENQKEKQMKHLHENADSSLPDYSQGIHPPDHEPGKSRRWYQAKVLPFVVRLILGGVFIYASVDKILHPAAFAEAVYNYKILPDALINLTTIILPWLELLLGIFLVSGVYLPGAIFLINILLVTFFVALVFNLARGLDIHCGCFTTSQEATINRCMCLYMIRDGVFLFLALYLFSHVFLRKRTTKNIER
jgi:uncharacterized membrane protein YphA (DoxX/SURF4 family)